MAALLEFGRERIRNLVFWRDAETDQYKDSTCDLKTDTSTKRKASSSTNTIIVQPVWPAISTSPEMTAAITKPKAAHRKRMAKAVTKDESDEEFSHHDVQADQEGILDATVLERVPHATALDEEFEGWSKPQLNLWNAINDRWFEPMLWSYWKMDFPTLPDRLFTSEKEDALIANWKGSAPAGAKAFDTLIRVGVLARERRKRGTNPAQLLAKEIGAYIKWSYRDAKIVKDNYIPLIVVTFASKAEDLPATIVRAEKRVEKLSKQYRQLWKDADPAYYSQSPTIFYIVLANTVMGIGSYDSSAEEPEFRHIFYEDWKHEPEDLWNAMAVAILVQQTRSWLVDINPKKKRSKRKPQVDPDL